VTAAGWCSGPFPSRAAFAGQNRERQRVARHRHGARRVRRVGARRVVRVVEVDGQTSSDGRVDVDEATAGIAVRTVPRPVGRVLEVDEQLAVPALRGEELVALARHLERYAADDRLHGDLPDAVGDGDLFLALGWEELGGKAPRWIRLEPRDLAARVTNRGGVRITDAHTEQAAALDDVDSYRIG